MEKATDYYDLGRYSRVVATKSQVAHMWFTRGLVWCYSFNHEAAIQCFEQAALHDETCVMAYWGVAYAIGPNYNTGWQMLTAEGRKNTTEKALRNLAKAREVDEGASPTETALVNALATRYPRSTDTIPGDLSPFNHFYAEAMREVYDAHGDDLDVIALFADAVMCSRPRQLWDLDTGETTCKGVDDARAALEKGLAQSEGRDHPGICHLYIHMMEMSPFPELALTAADQLRRIVPDGSHMQHMATHIDTACGDYRRSIDSNRNAVLSDDKYFAQEAASSLLYNLYRAHNAHAMAYSAMMSGRSSDALWAARRLPDILTLEFMSIKSPRLIDATEWQWATLPHVLIRFGHWDEILGLEMPADPELLCVSVANLKYAKAIALAVLGRTEEARRARDDFEETRRSVPQDRMYGPTSLAEPILAVASAMLEGELEYRVGNYANAFSALRRGIELEDKIAYADPPLWMQPVRHALGALLLEQGHSEEAEELYWEDLGFSDRLTRPKARINNVWGWHGLYECLIRNGKLEDARKFKLQRDIAVAAADIDIKASCFCRTSAVEGKSLGDNSDRTTKGSCGTSCC